VEKIKACKQKLSELNKYENIIKKTHVHKLIIFSKSKKKGNFETKRGIQNSILMSRQI
jgi:hypothetical protein